MSKQRLYKSIDDSLTPLRKNVEAISLQKRLIENTVNTLHTRLDSDPSAEFISTIHHSINKGKDILIAADKLRHLPRPTVDEVKSLFNRETMSSALLRTSLHVADDYGEVEGEGAKRRRRRREGGESRTKGSRHATSTRAMPLDDSQSSWSSSDSEERY